MSSDWRVLKRPRLWSRPKSQTLPMVSTAYTAGKAAPSGEPTIRQNTIQSGHATTFAIEAPVINDF